MDYSDFIVWITFHIHDKGQVIIRYYDHYANAYGGKKRRSGGNSINIHMIEESSWIAVLKT